MYDKANKIGYFRITNFGETTADETRAAVQELEKQGVRAWSSTCGPTPAVC